MALTRRDRHARRRRRRALVAGVALVLLAFAGCSDTADPAPPADGAEATTTTSVEHRTGTSLVEPSTGTSSPAAQDLVEAACAGRLQAETVGRVAVDAGSELSGIVASRANPGVYWVHDDSGAGPEIYAIAEDGSLLGTFALDTDAIDWEDIAIGPAEDGDGWSLVVGDIGDNDEARPSVRLLRVPEPQVELAGRPANDRAEAEPVDRLDAVTLTFPDRPHNAEALLVDPETGQVVIVTKELTGPAQIFVADAASVVDGATVRLTPAGSVDFGAGGLAAWVTGADVSPDGTVIAVRTYGGVHLFARTADQTIADALATTPCDGPTPLEVQGEAVAIAADGQSYLTVSEGAEALLHRTS
jgi:hypothetical protein